MGFGYVASPHNYYEGRLKLAGDTPVAFGRFVVADYKAGTAKVAEVADIKNLYFVAQENDTPTELGIDDLEQTVKVGAYLKLAKPQRDMILKTSEVTGDPVVGDNVKVQADGSLKKEAGNDGVLFVVRAIENIGAKKVYAVQYLV